MRKILQIITQTSTSLFQKFYENEKKFQAASHLSKIKTQLVGGTFGRLILTGKPHLYLLARAGKADMIPDAQKMLGMRFFPFKINLPDVPHDH